MLTFGRFVLQPDQRRLTRDGEPVNIGARAFDVLLALAQRRDRTVTKGELMDLVWPGLVVEENNLQVQISSLRKVFGPQAIATIPGSGYRFVAETDETAGSANAEPAPLTSTSTPATNLPASIPELFGRADDLALLGSLVRKHRLVCVVGAGGIGKSRLAQAVAHTQIARWPDGVWMVELAGLSEPALLAQVVARGLGVSLPERTEGNQALADALCRRETLIVLDNCEHLLEAVAELVPLLLDASALLHVLATSQEPLRLEIEQQYRVDPLAVPEDESDPSARGYGALQMFESRVRRAAPRYQLSDRELPMAIDLCRQLDGLPLAIELAAARVPLLGLRAVHDLLRERFKLLTASGRTGLRRHQTLKAAMGWSHSLLTPEQRRQFRQLGVFSGGFTLPLMQALCVDGEQDDWTTLDHLAALVDKSLVSAEPGEPVRYHLLESTRAFALEQLATEGETAALIRRHAVVMLRFLKRADDGNMDSTLRSDEYAALVLPEFDNLRAAYAWAANQSGNPGIAIGLAAHAGPLIDYSTEFAAWLLSQRSCLARGVADDVTLARFWRAMAAANMGGIVSITESLEAARQAVDCYRALHRPKRLFSALRLQAIWLSSLGDLPGARASLDEAAALIEPSWGAEFQIVVLRFRAWAHRQLGEFEAAKTMYLDAVRLANAAGDWRLEVIGRSNLCDLQWERGELDEAAQQLADLMDAIRQRPASDFELVEAATMRIWILAELGHISEASTALREALPVMRRMPKFRLEGCAYMLWRLGRDAEAARVLGTSAAGIRKGFEPRQINEERLARSARAGLHTTLAPTTLSDEMAAGENLSFSEVCELLTNALG